MARSAYITSTSLHEIAEQCWSDVEKFLHLGNMLGSVLPLRNMNTCRMR
jgi:hypothetical protein